MADESRGNAGAAYQPTILRDQLAIDRTMLANERTLLAYVRTSMAFAVVAGTLLQFFDQRWLQITGWALGVAALAVVMIGAWRFIVMKYRLSAVRGLMGPAGAHERASAGHVLSLDAENPSD